ncbi:glycosyltransferase family 4 protein [Enterococcus mundtii]|uniref:Glycosyltransferase WbuB n=1 Tax=Enterococcus mundtii TaxID=53346 RepID=A0A1V2UK69_ENTMU|nr:glycosyltransferase family 4 protein [Enterococcus mundtii]ONN43586.1 glycosyltransferase WbuB [Enterococcus mundtii]
MPLNILFITLLDFDSLADRNIYTDLMSEFVDHGHNISIISPTERKKRKNTHLIKDNNKCEILKLKIGNIQKTNKIEKGISTILIENQFIAGIKKYFSDKTFDLVIYSTPPVTFAKVIKYVKRRDNCKSYLLLKDIFPQNAVDLQHLSKKSIVYKYFRRKEIDLYKVSDFIGTMSYKNLEYIKTNNTFDANKIIEINPNSIKVGPIDSSTIAIGNVKRKYNIPEEKIVLLYGGNLGKPQGIDFLIDIIKYLEDNQDYTLVIVGSGTEYSKIENYLGNNKIKNTILINSLPKEEYKKIESISDIGLVFLDKKFTIPNIPSRILGYMQSQKPIVAAIDENTDLNEIIKKGKFGYSSLHGDLESFIKNILLLKDNSKRIELGKNAYNYLKDNYDVNNSYSIIMKHLKS